MCLYVSRERVSLSCVFEYECCALVCLFARERMCSVVRACVVRACVVCACVASAAQGRGGVGE